MNRSLAMLLVMFASCGIGERAGAEDWPAWRGPRVDGTSTETNLPVKWSETENVRWHVKLPALGNSTPIVALGKVFVTQANEDGSKRGLLCFDQQTGKELWSDYIDFDGEEPTHQTNPFCSASPVTDGEFVFAWHGSAGAVAYDMTGKRLWHRDLGTFTHIWGNASSPVIYGDAVILNLGPGDRAMVTALNKRTGETVWEVPGVTSEPAAFVGSWSTPVLANVDRTLQVLISQPHELVALDPATGDRVWSCSGLTDLVYTSPVVADDIAIAMSGFRGRALGVRMGGTGDITDERRLWITPEDEKEYQRIGSGVIRGDKMYMVNEPGILECIDIHTGEKLWKERVCGRTWSSLTWADGRFYIIDQRGTTTVFTVEPKLEIVAENALGGKTTNSSPVISDGHIFLRTGSELWCVGP